MLAVTHLPSPRMQLCQLTFMNRAAINYDLALGQHAEYRRLLGRCGVEDVVVLDVNRDLPDCCFVEDTAVVLDEVALIASMGSEARRPEPRGIEAELRKHRPVRHIELPATLDGGDVVLVRRTLLVGLSSRTNPAGVAAMADVVRPFGYRVTPVPVHGCLHLKSACTALPDGRLLVNRQWIDADALSPFGLVPVPPDEPGAADVLSIGRHVCLPDAFPRTAELIDRLGFEVHTIDLSEFAKAEGGVTCLSLVLTHRLHPQN